LASRLAEAIDRRDQRRAPGGDHHGLASHERVVADADASLAGEAAGPAHDGHAPLLEPGLLAGVVEVVDDLVAPPEDGAGVEVAGHGLAHARDAAHLCEQLAGAEQPLRGHARVEGALAADQVRLDHRDLESRLSEPPGAHLSRGPSPEDDDVEFTLAHAGHGTLRAWPPQTRS
jgi:hypothetical protein